MDLHYIAAPVVPVSRKKITSISIAAAIASPSGKTLTEEQAFPIAADYRGCSGVVKSVTVIEKAPTTALKEAITIIFAKNAFGTLTEGGALDLGSNTAADILGAVTISASDYTSITTAMAAANINPELRFVTAADYNDVHYAILAGGTTQIEQNTTFDITVHIINES